jgi:flagellar biogenesis protein FliO
VLALAVVLGLIVVLRWGGKRLMTSGRLGRGSRGVQVLGRTYLSPRQQVLILQVGRRLLVVGDSGGQLNTLCQIDDPDEAATLIAQLRGEPEPPPQTSFATVFRRARQRYADEPDAPASVPSDHEDPDPQIVSARQELNGLAERVRSVARHLRRT